MHIALFGLAEEARAVGGDPPRAGQTRHPRPNPRPGLGRAAQQVRAPFWVEGPLSVHQDRWGDGGDLLLPSPVSPSHRQYLEDRMDDWAEPGDDISGPSE